MHRTLIWLGTLAVAAILFIPASPAPAAAAHVCMDFPISRVGPECGFRSPQKIGTCGVAGRTEQVNVFRPGQTITVVIRETINHPSHYRVAFNPEGDSFPDPMAIGDVRTDHPLILVDGIEDAEEAVQTVEVTFPDVECENCTLQLIQVMYDKQGNGFGGANGGPNDNDDLYYSCADIALRANAEATSGGRSSTPGRWGALAALIVAGVTIRRRGSR